MTEIGKRRLGHLFGFLDGLNQVRNRPTKIIEEQPWVLSFQDLPDHPSVERAPIIDIEDEPEEDDKKSSKAEDDSSDYILRVGRPDLTHAPAPPENIKDWLNVGWEQVDGTVSYRESRNEVDAEGHTIIVRFDADAARVEAFQKWHAFREEWAINERPARRAMALFEKLYELHGRLEREGERFELIVGDGILSWRRPEGGILHPVLLKRIQLQFDADVPEFTFIETGMPTEIYSALFRSMNDVDGRLLGKCRDEVEKRGYHPMGAGLTSGFLRKFAQLLSAQGEYSEGFPLRIETDHPRISRNPFIFLRSRTLGFATAIEAILEDIKDRAEFPPSLLNIVGIDARPPVSDIESEDSVEQEVPSGNEDVDILLSKPANPEQLKLAQRLEVHGSVVVQGPPGTGKTHTIANLLGHLLSQGKSVLVTSHTSKALRVLREKVVDSLQPLCVSVLESDLDSRKQLEGSVARIVERLTSSDTKDLQRKAAALTNRRKDIITEIEKTRLDLLDARNGEYRDIVIAGQALSPSSAARLVSSKETADAWIPGPVKLGAPLPLSESELHELYQTNEAVTSHDESELGLELPELDDLPHPPEFRRAVENFQKLSEEKKDQGSRFWRDQATEVIIVCTKCNSKNRTRTAKAAQKAAKLRCGKCKTALELPDLSLDGAALDPDRIESLLETTQEAAALIPPDPNWSVEAIMAGWKGGPHREPWDNLIGEIDTLVKFSGESKELILRYGPGFSNESVIDSAEPVLVEIQGHFNTGGTLSFWTLLTRPAWKKLIDSCIVENTKPSKKEHFAALHAHVRLILSRKRVLSRWERMVSTAGGLRREDFGTSPEAVLEQFRAELVRLLNWHANRWEPILAELHEIGLLVEEIIDGVPPVTTATGPILRIREAAIRHLPPVLSARVNKLRWEESKKFLDGLGTKLKGAPRKARSELVAGLHSAVDNLNPDQYAESFDGLSMLLNKRKLLARRRELLDKLEITAPGWAAAIRHRHKPHDTKDVPHGLKDAWLWRQLHDEIEERNKISAEELQARLESLTESLQKTTAELIDKLAWAKQVEKTSHGQRQALTGWVETIRRIGRGTGRRAPRLEAEARKLMGECRSAVPVWIMPLARVVENFDPRRSHFDVVVVDEASQLDVMGLIALYMADQVVIVGDHEQVSPEAVGQNLDEVQHLIDEHLGEVPNANLYDGKLSVYDLAKTAFGGQLCLKEHFRCVEEIIQFSNHLCYHGQIRPLRDSSTAQLKPHLVDHRVDGQCDRNNVNRNESLAVASLLAAAIRQPEYSGATFGVVSLLGDDQARDIDSLLRRHLSPAIYEERRIVCGNAAHFQGDERDVMFLTLVDSPQGTPLSFRDQPLFRKRYNVAASRARDQMWVVHSLNAERDLQPGDLRRRLIQHAQDPMATVRLLEKQEARTDSEFERQVLTRLIDAGYRVKTQWRVGYYRIDMVVEGRDARLAVECDGDRYHTMDNLREDMTRQSVLERLGWKFIRIRGTRFFRDPDGETQRILSKLQSLGIEQLGASQTQPSAQATNQELTDRLYRAAEEIRQIWASDPAYVYEEHPAKRRRGGWRKASQPEESESRGQEPHRSQASTRATVDEEAELPLELEDSAESARSIDDIPQEDIREALRRLVPKGQKVEREGLLKQLVAALGQKRLGRRIRSRLNRAIGGETRAGNLETDWDFVWRP